MQHETVNIPVIRFRDPQGRPTCAVNFETGEHCRFLAVTHMGTREVCAFHVEPEPLYRRDLGLGSLEPCNLCPLWTDNPKISSEIC